MLLEYWEITSTKYPGNVFELFEKKNPFCSSVHTLYLIIEMD